MPAMTMLEERRHEVHFSRGAERPSDRARQTSDARCRVSPCRSSISLDSHRGRQSTKATAYADHFAARGVTVERVGSPQALVRAPAADGDDPARARVDDAAPRCLIGSSLGGLTAARVAERDDRGEGARVARAGVSARESLAAAARRRVGRLAAHRLARGVRLRDERAVAGRLRLHRGHRSTFGTRSAEGHAAGARSSTARTTRPCRSRTRASSRSDHPNVELIELDDGHQLHRLDSAPARRDRPLPCAVPQIVLSLTL